MLHVRTITGFFLSSHAGAVAVAVHVAFVVDAKLCMRGFQSCFGAMSSLSSSDRISTFSSGSPG